jgi:tRNA threonylcarbamoyladenosine biosynthesis protein TsaB
MLILSLDTTTRAGSAALLRDGTVVCEQAGDPFRDQAERLPADLATLLEEARLALRDLDAFAVATGPGSFTGLRVGIATMQGLAIATGKPLAGVSAFDALAELAGQGGGSIQQAPPCEDQSVDVAGRAGIRVATWIDAWRGEVFASLYENGREVQEPTVAPPAMLLERLTGLPVVFTGDGAALYEPEIRAARGAAAQLTEPAAPLLAGAVALIAARALAEGHRPLPHAIHPIYVRRPDAELARDRR